MVANNFINWYLWTDKLSDCYFLSFFCSGCIGLVCPCFLFGKNAEFLGSGTLIGSCTTHFVMWALVNTVCCLLTDGILLGLPGCFISCYACSYRSELRLKYNLQLSHFICLPSMMCLMIEVLKCFFCWLIDLAISPWNTSYNVPTFVST